MVLAPSEKRKSPRIRQAGPVLWRCLGLHAPQTGWLLEASRDGLAFAWRGGTAPKAGTILELLDEAAVQPGPPDRAIVRRTIACHDNLSVLAVEILQTRSFPPTLAMAKAAVSISEPKQAPSRQPLFTLPAGVLTPTGDAVI